MLYRKGGKLYSTEPARARTKCRNQPIVYNDMWFQSKLECRRYQQLEAMQRAGEIRELRRQIHFGFVVNGVKIGRGYTCDHAWVDKDGIEHYEDAKGWPDRMWRKTHDLMLACHSLSVSLWPPRETKHKSRNRRYQG